MGVGGGGWGGGAWGGVVAGDGSVVNNICDSSHVPSTHSEWLTAVSNSNSRESDTLFGPPQEI